MSEKSSGPAITCFIMGLISLILGWIPLIGWLIIVVCWAFGIKALVDIKKGNGSGRLYAVAGLALSVIPFFGHILFFGLIFGQ